MAANWRYKKVLNLGNGATFGPFQTGVTPFVPLAVPAVATDAAAAYVQLKHVVNTLGVGGGITWSFSDDNVSYTNLPQSTVSAGPFSYGGPPRKFWKAAIVGDGTTSITCYMLEDLVQDRPLWQAGNVDGSGNEF
jgi:hypothetical protein